jgi:hypothetical protein
MTPTEHARQLFEDAEKSGLDAPTEDTVSDALNTAMSNARLDCLMALKDGGFGQAAEFIERLENRMHAGDRVLHKLPRK